MTEPDIANPSTARVKAVRFIWNLLGVATHHGSSIAPLACSQPERIRHPALRPGARFVQGHQPLPRGTPVPLVRLAGPP